MTAAVQLDADAWRPRARVRIRDGFHGGGDTGSLVVRLDDRNAWPVRPVWRVATDDNRVRNAAQCVLELITETGEEQ